MAVPLREQGEPLPPDFPYSGQWLDKPRMFIYAPTAEQWGGDLQFTAELYASQENWCFGFDAEQLARLLGTDLASVLEANRDGRLELENVEANTPTGEGATMKRYTFRLGRKTGALIVERLQAAGNA